MLDEAGLISTQQGRGTFIWEAPTPEVERQLRRQSLEGLAGHFLVEAARQGFTPEEVKTILQTQVEAWQAGRLPEEVVLEE
jgi:DNA-binding transcriptional regulator YhcF (GntR family)